MSASDLMPDALPGVKYEARRTALPPVPLAKVNRLSKSSGRFSRESLAAGSTPDATAEPRDP
jgi:hypothetical protein